MSVILTVAAIALVAQLSLNDTNQEIRATVERIQEIKQAIQAYKALNGYVPCPAKPELPITDTNFGKEARTGGNCTAMYGSVPVRALALPDDIAFDAWKHRFTYKVDSTLATHDGCAVVTSYALGIVDSTSDDTPSADPIACNNGNSAYKACAAVAIISHGQDGHGAYPASGAATPAPYPDDPAAASRRLDKGYAGSVRYNTLMNAYITSPLVVQGQQSLESGKFDDIVDYVTGCFTGNLASCVLPWGGTTLHDTSVTAYLTATVPYGQTCASETRHCNNGALSGSYTFQNCSVLPGANCPGTPWGTINHGDSVVGWLAANGNPCSSQVRTCTNGTLSGTYAFTSCNNQCNLPWGGLINNGQSVTAYQSSVGPFGSACSTISQTRTCTNGTLSGSYTQQFCTEHPCDLPWGGSTGHGTTVTAYQTGTVNAPASCVSESRICSYGDLGGTYTFEHCSVLTVADGYLAVAHQTSPYVTIYKQAADTFTKLDDPATLPAGIAFKPAISTDGTYLAVPHVGGPSITIYKRSNDAFTKLSDPDTLPAGSYASSAAFSYDGTYLSVAHDGKFYLNIYKRSGDTFAKLADPDTVPAGPATDSAWSHNGTYLAVTHSGSPYLTIYKRLGDSFTKLSDPATLPVPTANGVSFSPDNIYLAVASDNNPKLLIYKRSGDTFTKLPDPATLPAGAALSAAFSPDGTYLSVAHMNSPYVTIYKRSGDTFTKLTDPATLPASDAQGTTFSGNGTYLSVMHNSSPYVTIYKRSADTFTKLSDPATLPTNTGSNGAFYSATVLSADIFTAYAAAGAKMIQINDGSSGSFVRAINPFVSVVNPAQPITVSAGDVNSDGVADAFFGYGQGGEAWVRILDGSTGSTIRTIDMGGWFGAGGDPIPIAAGDVNDDGVADAFAFHASGFPLKKWLAVNDGSNGNSLFSINTGLPAFSIAAGDANGDGKADGFAGYVTGGTGYVTIYSGADGSVLLTINTGVSMSATPQVAAGNVDDDGLADAFMSYVSGGTVFVDIYSGLTGSLIRSINTGISDTANPYVAAKDMNNDDISDAVVSYLTGGTIHVQVFSGADGSSIRTIDTGNSSSVDHGIAIGAVN